MKYLLLICLSFQIGCAVSQNESDENVASESEAEKGFSGAIPARPPCHPQKFYSDAIPWDFKMNPDCPPYIIDPPRLIYLIEPGEK